MNIVKLSGYDSELKQKIGELAEAIAAAQIVRNPLITKTQCRLAILRSLDSAVAVQLEVIKAFSASEQRQLIEDYSPTPLSEYPAVDYCGFKLVEYDGDVDSKAWAVLSFDGVVLVDGLFDEDAAESWADDELYQSYGAA